jgi:carboxylate-amine ligase
VTGVFAAYRGSGDDEAVDASGRLRGSWGPVAAELERLGIGGLASAAAKAEALRARRGVVVASWRDGRPLLRPLPMDPVPRVLTGGDWALLASGVEQRHRALNAFLGDAYRAAGRRRGDPDRAPELVRAGVLPEWAVAHSPSRSPDAVGLAWPGQPRAAVAAVDVGRTAAGSWMVLADHLRVPAGLGYALAGRDVAREVGLGAGAGTGAVLDPWTAVPLLLAALQGAAPPSCSGTPTCAVLSAGESDGTWFEHRLLADALGAPIVRPADLWPRTDGGVEAVVDGERCAIDVLYRRFGDGELSAHRSATGQPLAALLAEAVRTGRLGLANVPGNGLADDEATFAWVPAMIRFYLGEEPLLDSVRTWVLADDTQRAQVRNRLHELVLRSVGGYGGRGVFVGPECSTAELAQLEAEVAAAPHRFVAQEPVTVSTVPTLVEGGLVPRPVDLRVFSVAGARTRALPAPLTRLVPASGASEPGVGEAVKDTWLVG